MSQTENAQVNEQYPTPLNSEWFCDEAVCPPTGADGADSFLVWHYVGPDAAYVGEWPTLAGARLLCDRHNAALKELESENAE